MLARVLCAASRTGRKGLRFEWWALPVSGERLADLCDPATGCCPCW
jgi:hypothetical protein